MRRVPVQAWIDRVAKQPGLYEHIWTPTIQRRGGMAVVWAPYEFQRDGKTTHCGVDVFDFVKADGAWRIAGLMYTYEPDACAELKGGRR